MKKFICKECGEDLLERGFYIQQWNVFKKDINGNVKYSHSDFTDDVDIYCENCNEVVDENNRIELINHIDV